MLNIGRRLREERERLGLTQPQLSDLTGISKTTQVNYEQGTRRPDSEYLYLVAQAGADVNYIITGQRITSYTPNPDVIFTDQKTGKPVTAKEFKERLEKMKTRLAQSQAEIDEFQVALSLKPD